MSNLLFIINCGIIYLQLWKGGSTVTIITIQRDDYPVKAFPLTRNFSIFWENFVESVKQTINPKGIVEEMFMDLAYAETNDAGDNASLPHQYQKRGFALTELALTFKGEESSFHGTYKAGPETIQYSASSPTESAVLKAFELYVSQTAL